jgi:hypothetical protein
LLEHKDGLHPIYLFYNSRALFSDTSGAYPLHPGLRANWFPGCWLGCGFFPAEDDFGITATHASAVKDAGWGRKNRPEDLPMIPWHCLVCDRSGDPDGVPLSLPYRIARGLERMRDLQGRAGTGAEGDDDGGVPPGDRAPDWVMLLGNGVTEGLDRALTRANLRGVVHFEETREG